MYEPKDFSHLLGLPGFSDTLLNNHFTLYQGYVKNVNLLVEKLEAAEQSSVEASELERRFGWEFDGMRMHELYFENMTKEKTEVRGVLKEKIEKIYGGYEKWVECFKAKGMMRGIGWVVLFEDPTNGELFITWVREHEQGIPVNCKVLLVMDCWEHAYMTDYGIKKADYIAAFMNAIDWSVVEKRFV
ncbi:MAG: superoxide dismutase [Candidatus Pacebacteria bacterium]|nr:superoxide dismutase [Candidatus Paceibacterota bacterium]